MKKSKRVRKSLTVLVLTLVMMLSSSLAVFAESLSEYVSKHDSSSSEIASISSYLETEEPDGSFETVTTKDGQTYYVETKNVSKAENKIKSIAESGEVDETVRQISDNFDISPDFDYAGKILAPLNRLVSTVVGIAVVAITLLMTVNTAFDIAYIAFPVLRGMMIDSKNSGGAMSKKGADGSVSLRFVTDEAQFAVEQATTGNGGGNAMTTYFKKRIFSYIILSIMLFILLTGNISLITNLAVKVVSGLMSVLLDITA